MHRFLCSQRTQRPGGRRGGESRDIWREAVHRMRNVLLGPPCMFPVFMQKGACYGRDLPLGSRLGAGAPSSIARARVQKRDERHSFYE